MLSRRPSGGAIVTTSERPCSQLYAFQYDSRLIGIRAAQQRKRPPTLNGAPGRERARSRRP